MSFTNATAGVGVGVLITNEGKVLLMKRVGSNGAGSWSCPGGHIDCGESLETCAIRETKEETGVDVGEVKFLAVTNDVFEEEGQHYVTVWMQAQYARGEETVASPGEGSGVRWFNWDDLPSPLFLPLRHLVEGASYPRYEH